MVRNQWYAVLESKEVPRGKLVGVTRMGEKLAFWRTMDGKLSCLVDQCCHRGAAISGGKVMPNGHAQCPFHGFEYDSSGKVTLIPANGCGAAVPERYAVNSYPVQERDGFIYLWWGDAQANLPKLNTFEELEKGFTYSTIRQNWPVHYSRSIENQLDMMHLPFVHHNTIGRGGTTLVNGPHVQWDGDRMTFFVHNVVDDCKTVPEKPEEVKDLDKLFHLSFQFPNIWQNFISDKVRVTAAFAPVDECNTMLYVRFYQSFLTIPVLSHFVNWVSKLFNEIVLAQDRRVVITQVPVKSELSMGEKLAQGDRPIAEYRRRSHELMVRAGQTKDSSIG